VCAAAERNKKSRAADKKSDYIYDIPERLDTEDTCGHVQTRWKGKANSNIHRIDGRVETLDQQLIGRRFRDGQVVDDLGSRTG